MEYINSPVDFASDNNETAECPKPGSWGLFDVAIFDNGEPIDAFDFSGTWIKETDQFVEKQDSAETSDPEISFKLPTTSTEYLETDTRCENSSMDPLLFDKIPALPNFGSIEQGVFSPRDSAASPTGADELTTIPNLQNSDISLSPSLLQLGKYAITDISISSPTSCPLDSPVSACESANECCVSEVGS